MIDREMVRAAVATLVERLALFAPSIVASLLLIIGGWLAARAARGLAARLLKWVRINQVAEEAGLRRQLEQAEIKASPSDLLSRLAFWLVFAFFGVLALQRLGIDLSVLPVGELLSYLPRVAGAILLLIFGALVAQVVGRTVEVSAAGMHLAGHRALGRFVRGLLLVIVVLVAIEQLGLDVSVVVGTVTQLILIGAAGAALAFALGGGEIARNILAGFYIKDFLKTGQNVELGKVNGTLERIGVVNATVSSEGEEVFVPNSKFLAENVRRTRSREGSSSGDS